jgi:hypothetical protein
MFEIPVIDSVLKVGQFYSARDGSGVVVTFTDLPQECLLPSQADDFGKSLSPSPRAGAQASWST